MHIPKQLSAIAERLNKGHRVNRIEVRDLLHMFGAERRGFNKSQEIRTALDALELRTEPDFQAVWINSPIKIVSKREVTPTLEPDEEDIRAEDEPFTEEPAAETTEPPGTKASELQSANAEGSSRLSEAPNPEETTQPTINVDGSGVIQTLTSKSSDPTFRIGNLPAANAGVTTVSQDDSVKRAVTKMLQYDFSQLPIMQGEREVKGVISWRSIASRNAMGRKCERVADCTEDAQVIDANGTLFDAVPTVARFGYVLVRDSQSRKITGVVTASDLNLHFQQLTQPFLLLREIELHIREIFSGRITEEDIQQVSSAPAIARPASQVGDLSFGHYIRLFQRPEIWTKLQIEVDQGSFVSQLDAVRKIRNDVMHFDPDPMTAKQLDTLTDATKFLQELYKLFQSEKSVATM